MSRTFTAPKQAVPGWDGVYVRTLSAAEVLAMQGREDHQQLATEIVRLSAVNGDDGPLFGTDAEALAAPFTLVNAIAAPAMKIHGLEGAAPSGES